MMPKLFNIFKDKESKYINPYRFGIYTRLQLNGPNIIDLFVLKRLNKIKEHSTDIESQKVKIKLNNGVVISGPTSILVQEETLKYILNTSKCIITNQQ